MATNSFFRPKKTDQNLIEDLVIESIKIHGHDVLYMPRTLVKEDELFGEDVLSAFNTAVPMEMYIESVDGFEGEGDFISRFGLEIRDSISFAVSKKRFEQEIATITSPVLTRPMEGDIVYFPLTKGMFEIKFVEHEDPFYQSGKRYVYKLNCELFQYSQEDFDTGDTDIDKTDSTRDDLAINVTFTGGTGTYLVGEKIYQGGSYSTATFTANTVEWTSSSMILQIAGASGSYSGALGVTGNDSAAYFTSGTTSSPTIPVNIPVDNFSDNRDVQIEADDVFDFTETDPFSEGGY
jgi:hypothetical protein